MSIANARIKFKRDSTQNWNNASGMIPLSGEVIIYEDYKTINKELNGENKQVLLPGLKIGDGKTYVQDLPFIDEDLQNKIMEHINNQEIHTTLYEKIRWDNKINVDDNQEVINGVLIFNRN